MFKHRLFLTISLLATSTVALAHPGHAQDWMAATLHPWMGWDHLLAMLLVGVLAARYQGRQGPVLPLAFVVSLVGAAALAALGNIAWLTDHVETVVLLSLLILGGLVAAQKQLSILPLIAIVSVLGFAHGYAHGLELKASQAIVLLGMGASTALLHAAGYALSRGIGQRFAWTVRALGVLAGLGGLSALLLKM